MNVPNASSPRQLVLASTSRYRRELLARLGVAFEAIDPGVDEDAFKLEARGPEQLVATLALEKARACAALRPAAVLIGGDQCAEIDGETLGKPGTVEQAIAQLGRLSGRTHRLLTALCVMDASSGRELVHVDQHWLTVRGLSGSQIASYVRRDQPLDCAGSYKIESLGVALFERIEGRDPTAITGLPLMKLTEMLMAVGVDVLACGEGQRS
jgi:septum formation protein